MAKNILPVKFDKGSGTIVVLLHGLGNNYKSWQYVTSEVNYDECRIIALDLLGFGTAEKPKNADYSLDDHAKAVIATLDSLKIKKCIIMGHSMGCNIAIQVAQKKPNLISSLVLLGAPLYNKIPKGNFWSRITRSEGVYFKIFSFVSSNPNLTIKAAKTADALIPFIKGMQVTESTWLAYKRSLQNSIMTTEPFRELTKLKTPTLLVYGKLDTFVIKRTLKKAARRNKKFIKFMSTLGPHEITPLQGKKIAQIISNQINMKN